MADDTKTRRSCATQRTAIESPNDIMTHSVGMGWYMLRVRF